MLLLPTSSPLFSLLRWYQNEALDAILSRYEDGRCRMVVELPTGAGKTMLAFALIMRFFEQGERVLFLCPDVNLTRQTYENALKWFPPEMVGRVQGEYNEIGRLITVASVDTLALPYRRDQLLRAQYYQRFGLVIVDEAHGSLCQSYKNVLANTMHPHALLLGLTATPYRQDRQSLQQVFVDGLAYYVDILYLLAAGYLIRPVPYKVEVNGEEDRYAKVFAAWETIFQRKRIIIFADSIPDALAMHDFFRQQEVETGIVTSKTSDDKRTEYFSAFHEGHMPVLINYGTLTTGVDLIRTAGIIIGRNSIMGENPNKGLHTQMVGRATRPSDEVDEQGQPVKTEAPIVYLVSKQYPNIPRIMSVGVLTGSLTERPKTVRQYLLNELDEALENEPQEERRDTESPTPERIAEKLKELHTRVTSLFGDEGWTSHISGEFSKKTDKGLLIAERETLTTYHVYLRSPSGRSQRLTKEPLPAELARAAGTQYIERERLKEQARKGEQTPLNTLPITPEQKQHLLNRKGLNVPPDCEGMTQADYYQIEEKLKEWGSAFSPDKTQRIAYFRGKGVVIYTFKNRKPPTKRKRSRP